VLSIQGTKWDFKHEKELQIILLGQIGLALSCRQQCQSLNDAKFS
jgi:hypothetical protein